MIFCRCSGLQVELMIIFKRFFYLGPRKLACNYCLVESLAAIVGCRITFLIKVRGKSTTRCDKLKMTKACAASGKVLFQTGMQAWMCMQMYLLNRTLIFNDDMIQHFSV